MKNMVFPVLTEKERNLPFFLFSIGCRYNQEHVNRPNGYPYFQWIQCYDGEGELRLLGKTIPVRPNQGMFLYPNESHEYYPVTKSWNVDWISFGGHQLEHFIRLIGFDHSGVFTVTHPDSLLSKIRKAFLVEQSEDPLKALACSVIAYELLMDLHRYTSKTHDQSILQQYERLEPVFEYIETHYAKALTLNELADTIGVTPQHLCLLFRNTLKMRPFEYVNQIRVRKSKELMMKDKQTEIKAVAGSVGFEDASYFCHIFRRFEGISPGRFKKLHEGV